MLYIYTIKFLRALSSVAERSLDMGKAAGSIPAGRTLFMNIIYEDKNVLVINKPAGLLVHSSHLLRTDLKKVSGSVLGESTLVDWLIKRYPEIKTVGDEPKLRPGIVHRLDKDTSGIMIVAKNQPSFEYLKNQFQERLVKKTYLALVEGNLKKENGKIETPIKRFTKSREATTEYKVVEKFQDYSLLEVYPKTGRTHQIRLHLKSIGHPIVCEKLYARKPRCPFGLERHFLHALSLELTLPDGSQSRFETDLPDDLKGVLDNLQKK